MPRSGPMFEDYHELYPERQENESVELKSLYEPKPCQVCGKVKDDVEWKEVTETKPAGVMLSFTIETTLMRICKSCHYMKVNEHSWA